jgi:Uma2 family endonuclease
MAIAVETRIPDAKPAFELVDDRLCQKVSPQYAHAALQLAIGSELTRWARGRGRVGSEWRFTFEAGGRVASLVPDVGYLSYTRVPRAERAAAQEPACAPDVAVEILSPSDWREQVERKTQLYLAGGTQLVLIVDPLARTLTPHDAAGQRTYRQTESFAHPALPELQLGLAELFAALED